MKTTVFISYSRDKKENQEWVIALADYLEDHDVQGVLDVKDCKAGKDVARFATEGIRAADFVVLVCTKDFAKKIRNQEGTVWLEWDIMCGSICNDPTSNKHICLLRDGEKKDSIPDLLQTRAHIDVRGEAEESGKKELLEAIRKAQQQVKPGYSEEPINQRELRKDAPADKKFKQPEVRAESDDVDLAVLKPQESGLTTARQQTEEVSASPGWKELQTTTSADINHVADFLRILWSRIPRLCQWIVITAAICLLLLPIIKPQVVIVDLKNERNGRVANVPVLAEFGDHMVNMLTTDGGRVVVSQPLKFLPSSVLIAVEVEEEARTEEQLGVEPTNSDIERKMVEKTISWWRILWDNRVSMKFDGTVLTTANARHNLPILRAQVTTVVKPPGKKGGDEGTELSSGTVADNAARYFTTEARQTAKLTELDLHQSLADQNLSSFHLSKIYNGLRDEFGIVINTDRYNLETAADVIKVIEEQAPKGNWDPILKNSWVKRKSLLNRQYHLPVDLDQTTEGVNFYIEPKFISNGEVKIGLAEREEGTAQRSVRLKVGERVSLTLRNGEEVSVKLNRVGKVGWLPTNAAFFEVLKKNNVARLPKE